MASGFRVETPQQHALRALMELDEDGPDHQLHGVTNLGGTCWMGAILGLLRAVPNHFRELLTRVEAGLVGQRLGEALDGFDSGVVNPKKLLTAFRAGLDSSSALRDDKAQQDAYEGLAALFALCKVEAAKETVFHPSGKIVEWVTCRNSTCLNPKCKRVVKNSPETTNILILPLRDEEEAVALHDLLSRTCDSRCIETFVCAEGDETNFCTCTEALAQRLITVVPEIVFLVVARFRKDVRLTTKVTPSMEFRVKSKIYKLKSIVCHVGASPHMGHYVVYFLDGLRWYRQDDEKVAEIVPFDVSVVAESAYLFAYAS